MLLERSVWHLRASVFFLSDMTALLLVGLQVERLMQSWACKSQASLSLRSTSQLVLTA